MQELRKAKGTSKATFLVPISDLKFLNGLAAGELQIGGARGLCKNISLLDSVETPVDLVASRLDKRALRDRHGRWVRDAMDACGARDECAMADGEVVWS